MAWGAVLLTVRRIAILLAATVVLGGCDPGFHYRPQGWKVTSAAGAEWSAPGGDLVVETWGIAVLLGAQTITPEFEVRNRSKDVFVLERAELMIASGVHAGELPEKGAIAWRTVSPGGSRRIPVYWDFPQGANDVLGSNPRIVLEYRMDGEQKRLAIAYERGRP
jgi:hypothetical protein